MAAPQELAFNGQAKIAGSRQTFEKWFHISANSICGHQLSSEPATENLKNQTNPFRKIESNSCLTTACALPIQNRCHKQHQIAFADDVTYWQSTHMFPLLDGKKLGMKNMGLHSHLVFSIVLKQPPW
jgi:hypothetical protein